MYDLTPVCSCENVTALITRTSVLTSPPGPLRHQPLPLPGSRQPRSCCHYSFAFSRISCKWNLMICTLLGLASFTYLSSLLIVFIFILSVFGAHEPGLALQVESDGAIIPSDLLLMEKFTQTVGYLKQTTALNFFPSTLMGFDVRQIYGLHRSFSTF